MSTFVRMKREHRYTGGDGRKRILPAGWAGEIPDDVAEEACGLGRLVEDPREEAAQKKAKAATAKKAVKPKPEDYKKFDRAAVDAEIKKRNLPIGNAKTEDELRALLVADDAKKAS